MLRFYKISDNTIFSNNFLMDKIKKNFFFIFNLKRLNIEQQLVIENTYYKLIMLT